MRYRPVLWLGCGKATPARQTRPSAVPLPEVPDGGRKERAGTALRLRRSLGGVEFSRRLSLGHCWTLGFIAE
jgi:hypothetical protein